MALLGCSLFILVIVIVVVFLLDPFPMAWTKLMEDQTDGGSN